MEVHLILCYPHIMADIKLLIVEDDENLGQILKEYLELKGFIADLRRDGVAGLEAFRQNKYDLCLLDIMMPKMDGFTLGKEIKQLDSKTPFIFLTAKSMPEDTIKGFEYGADDYITKPFSMEELLLRLHAILRRTRGDEQAKERFEFSKYIFDNIHQQLTIAGKVISLTSKESKLLLLLCQNMNKILNRSAALKIIWGDDSYFNARSMDVYITKLRKHFQDDDKVRIITVHGEGFRFVVDQEIS